MLLATPSTTTVPSTWTASSVCGSLPATITARPEATGTDLTDEERRIAGGHHDVRVHDDFDALQPRRRSSSSRRVRSFCRRRVPRVGPPRHRVIPACAGLLWNGCCTPIGGIAIPRTRAERGWVAWGGDGLSELRCGGGEGV